MTVLARPLAAVDVRLGPGRRVGDRGHGDGLGERRRGASGEDDARSPAGRGDPEHDPEHVDDAVLSAEDDVRERAGPPVRVDMIVVVSLPLGDDFGPLCHEPPRGMSVSRKKVTGAGFIRVRSPRALRSDFRALVAISNLYRDHHLSARASAVRPAAAFLAVRVQGLAAALLVPTEAGALCEGGS